jgi:hypothetical protein
VALVILSVVGDTTDRRETHMDTMDYEVSQIKVRRDDKVWVVTGIVDGRNYVARCHDARCPKFERARDVLIDERDFVEDAEADCEGEMFAEFGMSWCAGGGSASDVNAAWRLHREDWIAGRIG